jgi:hypothetical protein
VQVTARHTHHRPRGTHTQPRGGSRLVNPLIDDVPGIAHHEKHHNGVLGSIVTVFSQVRVCMYACVWLPELLCFYTCDPSHTHTHIHQFLSQLRGIYDDYSATVGRWYCTTRKMKSGSASYPPCSCRASRSSRQNTEIPRYVYMCMCTFVHVYAWF